jgi:hypothetical protein
VHLCRLSREEMESRGKDKVLLVQAEEELVDAKSLRIAYTRKDFSTLLTIVQQDMTRKKTVQEPEISEEM